MTNPCELRTFLCGASLLLEYSDRWGMGVHGLWQLHEYRWLFALRLPFRSDSQGITGRPSGFHRELGVAHDVFISHSSHDRKIADQVCQTLEGARLRCWIAPRDMGAGRNWSEAIIDALEGARAMVVILSAGSNDSQQVLREITLAAEKKLPIIPLRVDESPVAKPLQFFLATPHRLDAFPPPLDRHLPKLVEAVRQMVPADGRSQEHRPPPPLTSGPRPLKVALVYKRNVSTDERLLGVLESGLKKLGHSVFIDRHMTIGVDWAREIDEQIRSSDAVVALLSESSIHSEMLTYEVQVAHDAAQSQGKPRILPVRVRYEGALPPDIDGILARLQYFHWKGPEDDGTLVDQVTAALAQPSKPVAAPSPGGALQLDSKFYVVRPTDQEFLTAISRRDPIVLVKGARQMGKTSLLARGLAEARAANIPEALTDFQKLSQSELASAESFYIALGDLLADRLKLKASPADNWNSKRSPNVNFERFVRDQVLAQINSHLVWGLDEVDRLFTCPFGSEVFALFRTWHNERAVDPSAPWSKLTLAIVYATEAHLFITDVNQSPFNVGTRLTLQDFTPEQVADLNRRYNSPLRSSEELSRLHRLTAGHPFLVQRALFDLSSRNLSLSELESLAAAEDGPFGDHLRRLLVMIAKDPALMEVMRGILRGVSCPSPESFYRLRSAGIIAGTSAHDCAPRCELYATYLRRHLQ